MQERKTVAIVGCGDIGIALGQALLADGHEVIGIRRDVSQLPGSFRRFAADVGSKNDVSKLPSAVDVWVYAVAADGRSETSYKRAYEIGPANIGEHITRSNSKRSVYISSTGIYEVEDGGDVTEETLTTPQSATARSLLAGEHTFQDLGGSVLRLGGIYGSGRHWLISAIQQGRVALRPGPPRYTNRIQRDDAVGLLRAMVLHDERLPKLVLGVDDEPAPWNDVVSWIAAALDITLGDGEVFEAPSGSRRASNKRCLPLYRNSLGYALRYPTYREGYHQALRDMGLIS